MVGGGGGGGGGGEHNRSLAVIIKSGSCQIRGDPSSTTIVSVKKKK